jgi:hypothetical protein
MSFTPFLNVFVDQAGCRCCCDWLRPRLDAAAEPGKGRSNAVPDAMARSSEGASGTIVISLRLVVWPWKQAEDVQVACCDAEG